MPTKERRSWNRATREEWLAAAFRISVSVPAEEVREALREHAGKVPPGLDRSSRIRLVDALRRFRPSPLAVSVIRDALGLTTRQRKPRRESPEGYRVRDGWRRVRSSDSRGPRVKVPADLRGVWLEERSLELAAGECLVLAVADAVTAPGALVLGPGTVVVLKRSEEQGGSRVDG